MLSLQMWHSAGVPDNIPDTNVTTLIERYCSRLVGRQRQTVNYSAMGRLVRVSGTIQCTKFCRSELPANDTMHRWFQKTAEKLLSNKCVDVLTPILDRVCADAGLRRRLRVVIESASVASAEPRRGKGARTPIIFMGTQFSVPHYMHSRRSSSPSTLTWAGRRGP
ncbi:hypothetical protein EVAR_14431_1 [Eumeta japonica]|uniref:Uncharacterized protein n=1 Tax=Eumeta variegata TaxID=151549 RepID=A0A4C1TX80_EUMVA|nr:hypothetical protein EVAR_14431_1 [Eumeta japonica]